MTLQNIDKYFPRINELTKTSLLRLTRQEVICAVTHNIMLNPVTVQVFLNVDCFSCSDNALSVPRKR